MLKKNLEKLKELLEIEIAFDEQQIEDDRRSAKEMKQNGEWLSKLSVAGQASKLLGEVQLTLVREPMKTHTFRRGEPCWLAVSGSERIRVVIVAVDSSSIVVSVKNSKLSRLSSCE